MRNGAPSNTQSARPRRLVALAYILAISIPPVGLIVGLVLVFRPGRLYLAHGVAVVALSVIVSVVWVVFLTSSAVNTPTPNY